MYMYLHYFHSHIHVPSGQTCTLELHVVGPVLVGPSHTLDLQCTCKSLEYHTVTTFGMAVTFPELRAHVPSETGTTPDLDHCLQHCPPPLLWW